MHIVTTAFSVPLGLKSVTIAFSVLLGLIYQECEKGLLLQQEVTGWEVSLFN